MNRITRKRPKTDRIACPRLVRRLNDTVAGTDDHRLPDRKSFAYHALRQGDVATAGSA